MKCVHFFNIVKFTKQFSQTWKKKHVSIESVQVQMSVFESSQIFQNKYNARKFMSICLTYKKKYKIKINDMIFNEHEKIKPHFSDCCILSITFCYFRFALFFPQLCFVSSNCQIKPNRCDVLKKIKLIIGWASVGRKL